MSKIKVGDVVVKTAGDTNIGTIVRVTKIASANRYSGILLSADIKGQWGSTYKQGDVVFFNDKPGGGNVWDVVNYTAKKFFKPIMVEVGDGDYIATVYEDHIKVGCQKISFDQLDNVYAAVMKARAFKR